MPLVQVIQEKMGDNPLCGTVPQIIAATRSPDIFLSNAAMAVEGCIRNSTSHFHCLQRSGRNGCVLYAQVTSTCPASPQGSILFGIAISLTHSSRIFHLNNNRVSVEQVKEALLELGRYDIIQKGGNDGVSAEFYQFTHDKIQQTADSLLEDSEGREELHLVLCKLCLEMIATQAAVTSPEFRGGLRRDYLVYLAVHQWNRVPSHLLLDYESRFGSAQFTSGPIVHFQIGLFPGYFLTY